MHASTAPVFSPPATPSATATSRRVARVVLAPWCRLDVTGREHVPAEGGVLIAANHASHADSIALGLAVRKRVLSFLGDHRLIEELRLVGRHLETLGMVPLARGDADAEALDRLMELLRAGHAVVVYPEGSRTRTGEVHRLRSGVARIAALTGVPVVPAGLAGTAALWPVDRGPRWRGGRVHVRFGAPLPAPDDTGADRRRFSEALHAALVDLSGAPGADHFAPVAGGA